MPRPQRYPEVVSLRLPAGTQDAIRELLRPGEQLPDGMRRLLLAAIEREQQT